MVSGHVLPIYHCNGRYYTIEMTKPDGTQVVGDVNLVESLLTKKGLETNISKHYDLPFDYNKGFRCGIYMPRELDVSPDELLWLQAFVDPQADTVKRLAILSYFTRSITFAIKPMPSSTNQVVPTGQVYKLWSFKTDTAINWMFATVDITTKSATNPQVILTFDRTLNGLDVKYYHNGFEVNLITCISLINFQTKTKNISPSSTLVVYPQGTNNNLLFRTPSQETLLTNLMKHVGIMSRTPL